MERIGIIGAMAEEVELMLQELSDRAETAAAGIVFYTGNYRGKDVIVCKCGVGKVNAAVCTQLLIDRFGARRIVFTGVAGALHPQLNIGDIVVSTECMQHDMDVTALGFARGVIPFADESVFKADESLVELAVQASELLHEGRTIRGRVLSGDQFVASRETVKRLYEELGGACTEMEGAAVAQVCHLNGVPFVVIRSMSDKADGSAHMNFPEFTKLASANSHRIVSGMLERM